MMFNSYNTAHRLIFLVTFMLTDNIIMRILSFSIPELFGLQRQKSSSPSNALLEEPNNFIIADTFISYTSINIRGGNSKFKYIPPKNYREIFIYQLPQFVGELKNLDMLSNLLPRRLQKRNAIPSDVEELQALELAAMEKGVVANCKWAIPFPSYPLEKLEHCTRAELKSLIKR